MHAGMVCWMRALRAMTRPFFLTDHQQSLLAAYQFSADCCLAATTFPDKLVIVREVRVLPFWTVRRSTRCMPDQLGSHLCCPSSWRDALGAFTSGCRNLCRGLLPLPSLQVAGEHKGGA